MPRKKRASGRGKSRSVSPRKTATAQAVPEENEAIVDDGETAESEAENGVETNPPEEEAEAPPSATELAEPEAEVESVKSEESSEVPPAVTEVPAAETESVSEESDAAVVPATNATASASARPPVIPPEALDDKDSMDTEFWTSLLTNKQYLVEVSNGYSREENLKIPLKGFTSEDETQLFPVIETMSAKLYNIVTKITANHKKDIEGAIKRKKGVVRIPNECIKAYLCHVRSLEPPSETEKSPSISKRAPHPFLLTEDENMFTEEKLKKLRAVLDAGWKREVVMRSPGSTGRKTGDVYYYSPSGTKFRSSKQVAQYLAQRKKDNPFTIDNFTFAKVRISTNPDQEIVRKAYDGNPPRRPPSKPAVAPKGKPAQSSKGESSKASPKPSTSSSSKDSPETDSRAEEPVKGVSSRRSIQPPKRYSGDAVLLLSKRPKMQDDKKSSNSKGLMQMGMLPPKYPKGMEDTSSNLSETNDYNETGSCHEDGSGSNNVGELADDSLFAISALRQSGGIDVEKMHQYVENQKKLAMKAASGGRPDMAKASRPTPGGSKGNHNAELYCSIRCAGMTGVIPNLQCTRCLCLYHAECLGLPPNLIFNKYVCSNCTDKGGAPSSAAGAATAGNSQKPIMKKPSEMRRGPPGLAPLPPHSRVPGPGRDITVTLAGKEHVAPVRMPARVGPSASGMARGMVRPRGGAVGPHHHIRSPGQRVIVSDGSSISIPSGNQQMMKRGRGRPPGIPVSRMPPQINKNLTITQLPRLHGAPPVPNLQPMRTPKPPPAKVPIPSMAGVKPRQVIPVPNLMKPNAFRVSVPPPSLSGRTFKKVSPQVSQQNPSNLRLNYPHGTAAHNRTPPAVYTTVSERANQMKRCPQTVCVIGNKKFVVLPKKAGQDSIPATTTVTPVGNGGLAKGSFTITETVRSTAAESNSKQAYKNSENASNNDKQLEGEDEKDQKGNNNDVNSADEDTPSTDDSENNQNSDENDQQPQDELLDLDDDDEGGNIMMQDDEVMTEAVSAE